MSGPLRIYAGRAYLEPGVRHVPLLWPFFGSGPARDLPRPDLADRYLERAPELFELTDLETADVAVFPHDWKLVSQSPARAHEFVAEARAAGVTPLLFFTGDSNDPLPFDDVIVVRTSLLRSRRRTGEFAQPGFHEDLLDYCGGELPVRSKPERATVGFCGVALVEQPSRGAVARSRRAAGIVQRAVLERLGRPLPQDVFVRARSLEALARQDAVATNVVVRSETGGGAFFPELDRRLWERVRREYVDNAIASDYILCARGVGNWSYRLYETLSLGRIPVFVDTDCVLPYDFLVKWRDYVVWVGRRDVSRIGEKVAAFHERLSESDFVELQHAGRRLWEDYLSPEGFFEHFHLHLAEAQTP